ncbi:unnamed protein product, partial [Tetraodon nigroviridis]
RSEGGGPQLRRARLRRINQQHGALLLLLGGCCSGMTCCKHEGKHAWSNTLQREPDAALSVFGNVLNH